MRLGVWLGGGVVGLPPQAPDRSLSDDRSASFSTPTSRSDSRHGPSGGREPRSVPTQTVIRSSMRSGRTSSGWPRRRTADRSTTPWSEHVPAPLALARLRLLANLQTPHASSVWSRVGTGAGQVAMNSGRRGVALPGGRARPSARQKSTKTSFICALFPTPRLRQQDRQRYGRMNSFPSQLTAIPISELSGLMRGEPKRQREMADETKIGTHCGTETVCVPVSFPSCHIEYLHLHKGPP